MVRPTHFLAALTSLTFAVTILAPAPALAAPTWQPVSDLSATGFNAGHTQVAVNGAGTSMAIWAFHDGTHYVVESATRPAGGIWSNGVLPRPDTLGTDFYAEDPQIALDQAGNATAIWYGAGLQAATREAGGAWTTPTIVAAGTIRAQQLVVDAAGNVTAIWVGQTGISDQLIHSATRAAGGTWSAPVVLSSSGFDSVAPDVAVDKAGNTTAVWTGSDGTNKIIQTATRPVSGAWSAPSDLSAGGENATSPQIAIDAAGNATAIWHRPSAEADIQTATRPAGGTWSAGSYIPNAKSPAADVAQIAFDAAGNTTALWRGSDSVNSILQSSSRSASGTWSAPVNVSATGRHSFGQRLVVDAAGTATAVWHSHDGTYNVVQFATRSPGGTWSTPDNLSATGGHAIAPEIALDPAGDAVAVWIRGNPSFQVAQARGLDAAGPQITSFIAPTNGVPGQAVDYSVSATDVWSTISTTNWEFGDGSSASGPSVSHVWANAGSYPVTLTLTDTVGNATTRSVTVTVAAPAPPTTSPTPVPTATTSPTTTPAITRFKLKPAKIRAVGSTSDTPARTRATIILTAPAKVTLAFKGKTKAKLVKTLRAGKNTFKLTAKIAKLKLKPGKYKIRAVATNTAGTSAPVTIKLKVVR